MCLVQSALVIAEPPGASDWPTWTLVVEMICILVGQQLHLHRYLLALCCRCFVQGCIHGSEGVLQKAVAQVCVLLLSPLTSRYQVLLIVCYFMDWLLFVSGAQVLLLVLSVFESFRGTSATFASCAPSISLAAIAISEGYSTSSFSCFLDS